MKNKNIAIILLIIALIAFSFSVIAFAKEFSDIDQSHWAFSYVDELSSKGIINGYDDGSYRPDGTVTRAEFIKLMDCTNNKILTNGEYIIQMKGLEFENWYDKYIYMANIRELIPYSYNSGDYNQPIERYEMAGILEQFALYENLVTYDNTVASEKDAIKDLAIEKALELKYIKNKKITHDEFDIEWMNLSQEQQNKVMELVNESYVPTDKKIEPLFDDIYGLNSLDIRAINTAKNLGIINGYEDGTFKPNNKMTRAEVAVVMSKYIKLVEGAKQ